MAIITRTSGSCNIASGGISKVTIEGRMTIKKPVPPASVAAVVSVPKESWSG